MRAAGTWYLLLGLCPLLCSLSCAAASLQAQTVDAGTAAHTVQAQDKVPARADAVRPDPVRMARLTFVAGAVSVQRTDNTAEDSPVLNMPLTEGTRLLAGDYGQAEIEFEDGSVVRLTPGSAVSLDVLSVSAGIAKTQFTVLHGLVYAELRKAAESSYRVEAAGMEVMPLENATLRLKVEDVPATLALLTGSARVEKSDGFRTVVKAGETLQADDHDAMRFTLSQQVDEETWDRWNESRDELAADQADKRTEARNSFAGNAGYGWADLDSNGSWYDLPGSGQVWQPDVADEGFDPYGFGSWVWSGQGGYVFASGYAWGWTPFCCGYWDYYPTFGWGWTPQPACESWGEAPYGDGTGGGRVRRGPPHYRPVPRPLPGPGTVHPILRVRGPDGARPPVLRGGPILFGGVLHQPLRPVGSGGAGHGLSAVGASLDRDFPVASFDRLSRRPVRGVEPGHVAGERGEPRRPDHPVAPVAPANPVFGSPVHGAVGYVAAPGASVPVVHTPMAPPANVPVVHIPIAPPAVVPRPVAPPQPIRAPAPIQAAPVRSAPAPAPARARNEPARTSSNPK